MISAFRTPVALMILAVACCRVSGQEPDSLSAPNRPDTIHKGRLTGVLVAQGAVYAATLTGLYFLWYKDYPQSAFHFFNDTGEWLQVDKCGHMITTYYISGIGYASYRWAGLNNTKSAWYGGLLGMAYTLNIELLDAFSTEWGFSAGDLAANTLGCLLFTTQQLVWKEQRFVLKFSYHPTEYAQYRQDLLGENFIQRLLKDYNGQTYWLSGNIHSFLPERSRFPKWLSVSVGYGAEGMTGSFSNIAPDQVPEFQRYRQFYLSLDADLTRIPTRSKTLKALFTVLGFIKIPFPAIEYNTSGVWRFHYLYF